MTTSAQDTHWMHRALDLARRGIGLASPNPAVGCVIVDKDGELVGEGWHEYDLLDHAEIAALKDAAGIASEAGRTIHSAGSADWVGNHGADRLKGATAYVTLEPCNHTGRTGPCTQALIAAGVSRVVAATTDPNPTVAGHGMEALHAAGLQTEIGVCQTEARRINEGFAKWIRHKRPFVLMKTAMSLDGRIGPPPESRHAREPYWITSEESRAAVQTIRHQSDAILTGIGTVLADDPLLTDRTGRRRRRPLLRVILDSALRIPLDSKIVRSAQNDLLIFTLSSDEPRARELRARGVRVEVLPDDSNTGFRDAASSGVEGNDRVSLSAVLDRLGSEGILNLLIEAGSRLNSALLAENLVDRVQFFVSPQIMGGDAVPAFVQIPRPFFLADVEIAANTADNSDIVLTSLITNPWQTF
jgi:diaminohydroxyphosphoribosylaminopyrimidine deaminase / 5-amino-6-(5-phosphoribosylamino)uracil reductase